MPSHDHTLGSHSHKFTPSGDVSSGGAWSFDIRPTAYNNSGADTVWARSGISLSQIDSGGTSPFEVKETIKWNDLRISHGGHGHSFSGSEGTTKEATGNTGSAGSDSAHDNMPPYLVAYCWKRTA